MWPTSSPYSRCTGLQTPTTQATLVSHKADFGIGCGVLALFNAEVYECRMDLPIVTMKVLPTITKNSGK